MTSSTTLTTGETGYNDGRSLPRELYTAWKIKGSEQPPGSRGLARDWLREENGSREQSSVQGQSAAHTKLTRDSAGPANAASENLAFHTQGCRDRRAVRTGTEPPIISHAHHFQVEKETALSTNPEYPGNLWAGRHVIDTQPTGGNHTGIEGQC